MSGYTVVCRPPENEVEEWEWRGASLPAKKRRCNEMGVPVERQSFILRDTTGLKGGRGFMCAVWPVDETRRFHVLNKTNSFAFPPNQAKWCLIVSQGVSKCLLYLSGV